MKSPTFGSVLYLLIYVRWSQALVMHGRFGKRHPISLNFHGRRHSTADGIRSSDSRCSLHASARRPSVEESKQLLIELEDDFDALSLRRPPTPSAETSIPSAIVSAGSSYTRLWKHATWISHSRPPHQRYIRHLLRWPASTTLLKILPSIIICSAWSVFLSITLRQQNSLLRNLAGMSGAFMSYLSAPLALLLTLRANASLNRLLEAREQWGKLLVHTRALSSLLKIYLFPHFPHASCLAVRYLATLGWVLKSSVRPEPIEFRNEVLRLMLNDEEYEYMTTQRKATIAITSRLRHICAVAISNIPVSGSYSFFIEERIKELENVVGNCERLFTSPIPPTYSRHLSRTISIFMTSVPLSLIASGLSTLGVAAVTAIAAFVIIGLDEIGIEIEHSFAMLPLQQLAGASQDDVRDQFLTDMPEVKL